MRKILFIISMAVAVTFKFDGQQVYFYYKYFIASAWTVAWIYDFGVKKKKISAPSKFCFKMFVIPTALLYIWTLVIWVIDKPIGWNSAYLSTTTSNILALVLAATCAGAAAHFFGRKAIKYTIIAITISTVANTLAVLTHYDIRDFVQYLRVAWIVTDLDYSSLVTKLSLAMEVHDSTVACGIFIFALVFFYKNDNNSTYWLHLVLMIICAYLGFKRLVIYGLIAVVISMMILHRRPYGLKNLIKFFSAGYIILCFVYVIALKTGGIELLANKLNINFSGRFIIYHYLTNSYDISPFYFGKGYGFINKAMFDATGFQSHSDIVRMYAEMGMLPYLLWLHHYLVRIPTKAFDLFGEEASRVYMASAIYIFVTYFAGNSMNLFASQFSFMLLPMTYFYSSEYEGSHLIKIRLKRNR